jgi:hypothetical protein
MTKRRNRHHRKTGGIKALMLTASVIATIGGAHLLELQEPGQASTDAQSITIVEPATNSTLNTLAQPSGKTTIDLKPIPQVVVPRLHPVARARSSM